MSAKFIARLARMQPLEARVEKAVYKFLRSFAPDERIPSFTLFISVSELPQGVQWRSIAPQIQRSLDTAVRAFRGHAVGGSPGTRIVALDTRDGVFELLPDF